MRSSLPTTSAPAASASRALSPSAKTATRTILPVPAGSDTEPRICWSAWRVSMPSRKCASTVSSKFARRQLLGERHGLLRGVERVLVELLARGAHLLAVLHVHYLLWSKRALRGPPTSPTAAGARGHVPASLDGDAHRAGGALDDLHRRPRRRSRSGRASWSPRSGGPGRA